MSQRIAQGASLVLTLTIVSTVLVRPAQGADGVVPIMTNKSIPEATVSVIDPESGTSSGGGTTDVNVGPGDIILFQMTLTAIPQNSIHGVQSYITDYIPANTEVVGIRIIDAAGLTIPPNVPGLAPDDCGTGCNGFNAVPCSTGTCNLDDGSLAQLYGDTGMWYTASTDLLRFPSTTFLDMENGMLLGVFPQQDAPASVTTIDTLLSKSTSDYYSHNFWDLMQVYGYGATSSSSGNSGTGNTPWGYGSPVAGPQTHYPNEASVGALVGGSTCDNTLSTASRDCDGQGACTTAECVCVSNQCHLIEFNDTVGPWNRTLYPGSVTTGYSGIPAGNLLAPSRSVVDPDMSGFRDITPNNPLPSSHVDAGTPGPDTTAIRSAMGELRVGREVTLEIALRVLATPLDPVQGADVNCAEVTPSELSATTDMVDHNPWVYYLPTSSCLFLNLLFDITADKLIALTGEIITETIKGKNLSIYQQTAVFVYLEYDSTRISYVAGSSTGTVAGAPAPAPTLYGAGSCPNGSALACLEWDLGTLQPSDEYDIQTQFTAGGGGGIGAAAYARYISNELPLPGYTTMAVTAIKNVALTNAGLDWTAPLPFAGAGGTATLDGTIINDGNNNATFSVVQLLLPAGWTVANGTVGGVAMTCGAPVSNLTTCVVNGGMNAFAVGQTRVTQFTINIPGGTPTGLYGVDLAVRGTQSAQWKPFETYFRRITEVAVGERRSDVPTIDCPIDRTAPSITGTTTEPDGTLITLYFNGIARATADASGGVWTVDASDWDDGTPGTFGELYSGLEIRATADATSPIPGGLQSELSAACFVSGGTAACADGLDNDGDGLIDFPADPGCESTADGNEADPPPPECSDGLDNDANGLIDFPDDLSCSSPYDLTEDGAIACSDGLDNDGDGLIDFPNDPGCDDANDPNEIDFTACQDGLDNDGDGLVDFPEDPGCHSAFDNDEIDFVFPANPIKARLLILFDTSGSMNWNTCAVSFTGGDGSLECPGDDVACADCSAAGCDNGLADDSRISKVKRGISDAVSAYGSVEWGLMRFHQKAVPFACPSEYASLGSGGWQGAGAAPCSGGFNAGDLLVGFSPENVWDILAWMDFEANYPGNPADPPRGMDRELRGSGTTPLAGSLGSAQLYLDDVRLADAKAACRPYRVILVTDGQESCGGDPVAAAAALDASGFPVHVVGFATTDVIITANLNAIAAAGGTGSAVFADNEAALSAAVGSIVSESILVEICNGVDDDCDCPGDTNGDGEVCTCNFASTPICDDGVDEGFLLGQTCNNGMTGVCYLEGVTVCRADGLGTTCDAAPVTPPESPDEWTCDGLDNDCDCPGDTNGDGCVCCAGDWNVDEGLFNACGTCDASPEICDWLDNDCNGTIDDVPSLGATCTYAHPNVPPFPGDEGECELGALGCDYLTGELACIGFVGPVPELCDCADNDCDGETDEPPTDPGDPPLCPAGSECIDCWCVVDCIPGEFPCGSGYTCDPNTNMCMPDECTRADCPPGFDCALDEFCPTGAVPQCTGACAGACAPDEYCLLADGSCHEKPCVDLCDRCAPGVEICVDGVCLEDNCYNFPGQHCVDGEVCIDVDGEPTCVANPCVQCDAGVCVDIECGLSQYCNPTQGCVDSCAYINCERDEVCSDGVCQESPCAGVSCEDGQVCSQDGQCIPDPCASVDCGPGRICYCGPGECSAGTPSECEDDLCQYIHCPMGSICVGNECVAPVPRTWVLLSGGGGCNCRTAGADGGAGLPVWLLVLVVLGAVLLRRLRSGKGRPGPLPLLMIAAGSMSLLVGAGCNVDPECVDCWQCYPTNLDASGIGVEICDGIDNDCDCPGDTNEDGWVCGPGDENVDEGFDLSSDLLNCGACGNMCLLENAVPTCEDGTCLIESCQPGFYDINGDPTDGCEYHCLPTNGGIETCDGLDNDCDCPGDTNGDGKYCSVGDENVDENEDLEQTGEVGHACGLNVGECAQGVTQCVDGMLECVGEAGPTAEICDDLDNDCDGWIDELFYTKGNSCFVGTGACRMDSVFTCDASSTGVWCGCTTVIGGGLCDNIGDELPAQGNLSQVTTEVCNGLDDDCDGQLDNDAPGTMVHIVDATAMLDFWIDVYEASKPDATDTHDGTMMHRSCSEPGRLPWSNVSWTDAAAACAAAGKRLCTEQEWQAACQGTGALLYPYGNTYDPQACNGEDYDPDCAAPDDDNPLATGTPYGCPPPATTLCLSEAGVSDMSGNLMEWTGTTASATPLTYRIRGGAFNNIAPALTCRFDFISAEPDFIYQDLGFRCCMD